MLKDTVFVWNPKKSQVSVLGFLHQARNVSFQGFSVWCFEVLATFWLDIAVMRVNESPILPSASDSLTVTAVTAAVAVHCMLKQNTSAHHVANARMTALMVKCTGPCGL